jgi:hypothetical protein
MRLPRARATAPRQNLEEDWIAADTMLSSMTVDDDISTARVGAGRVWSMIGAGHGL